MNICAHTMSELPEEGCRERGQHEACEWCGQPVVMMDLEEPAPAPAPAPAPEAPLKGAEWRRSKLSLKASEGLAKRWAKRRAKAPKASEPSAPDAPATAVNQLSGCEGCAGPAGGGMAAEPEPLRESPIMGVDPADALPSEADLDLLDAQAAQTSGGDDGQAGEMHQVPGGVGHGDSPTEGAGDVGLRPAMPDLRGLAGENQPGQRPAPEALAATGEVAPAAGTGEAGDYIEGYVLRSTIEALRATAKDLRERGLARASLPMLFNEFNNRLDTDNPLRLVDTTELRALVQEAGLRMNTVRGQEGVLLEARP